MSKKKLGKENQVLVLWGPSVSNKRFTAKCWQDLEWIIRIWKCMVGFKSHRWKRSPWLRCGRGDFPVSPHQWLCLEKCCSPSISKSELFTETFLVTHLTPPLENKTGLRDCTIVFKTILIGDLNSLVHGNYASQRPEICPVEQRILTCRNNTKCKAVSHSQPIRGFMMELVNKEKLIALKASHSQVLLCRCLIWY